MEFGTQVLEDRTNFVSFRAEAEKINLYMNSSFEKGIRRSFHSPLRIQLRGNGCCSGHLPGLVSETSAENWWLLDRVQGELWQYSGLLKHHGEKLLQTIGRKSIIIEKESGREIT